VFNCPGTCKSIVEQLLHKYVKLPQGETVKEAMDGFDQMGFPQAVGAIDGSHIPIVRPNENATDFYNRKCFHSILLQAVVGHQGIFIDIYTG